MIETKCCNEEKQKEELPLGLMGETRYVCLKCGEYILIGQLDEEELVNERQNREYVDEEMEAKADLKSKSGGEHE